MPRAYYNEIEPYAAAWLRNLIAEGLIAPGDVDERSIADVQPSDLEGYGQCHFFAGIGGWSYALRLAGWNDAWPVWTGSCPCQPFSVAGARKGFDDKRHLWPEFKRLIAQRSPSVVYGEQVTGAADWLRVVRSDLEAMGYAVGAIPIQAASAGADHLRDRFWFVADADSQCGQVDTDAGGRKDGSCSRPVTGPGSSCDGYVADSDNGQRLPKVEALRTGRAASGDAGDMANAFSERGRGGDVERQDAVHALAPGEGDGWIIGADGKARRIEPGIRLLAHGVPARVGKLRAFGNAIDPRPAAAFIASTPAFLRLSDQADAA